MLTCNQVLKSKLWPSIISMLVKILTDHAERDVGDPLKALKAPEGTFLSPFAHQNGNAKMNISKRQIIFELLLQIVKKELLMHVQNAKK